MPGDPACERFWRAAGASRGTQGPMLPPPSDDISQADLVIQRVSQVPASRPDRSLGTIRVASDHVIDSLDQVLTLDRHDP